MPCRARGMWTGGEGKGFGWPRSHDSFSSTSAPRQGKCNLEDVMFVVQIPVTELYQDYGSPRYTVPKSSTLARGGNPRKAPSFLAALLVLSGYGCKATIDSHDAVCVKEKKTRYKRFPNARVGELDFRLDWWIFYQELCFLYFLN
jgi:hypothetical protein